MNPSEPRRVVLLGASNLAQAFPRVLAHSRQRLGSPLEILSAHGAGRSYGAWSSVLFRELPGIGECGLWRALERASERAPGRETFALLTDVGNDLLYGAGVERIAGWLERDLDRLTRLGARIAMTRLPLASIERLPAWRFLLVRSLLFPGRRIGFEAARERARALDERMVDLARGRLVTLIMPVAEWYGVDPIHIRRSRRDDAWREILSAWGAAQAEADIPRLPTEDRLRVNEARPERRRLLGRTLEREQPSACLLDGTTVSLY